MSFVPDVGRCVCGKLSFDGKARARRALRQRQGRLEHVEGHRLHVYRCQVVPRYWHIGHMPAPIAKGEVPRNVYGTRRGGTDL